MKIETCEICGERGDRIMFEERNGRPYQIGWVCVNDHENLLPPPPRPPLHQGAIWLDEVGETLEADSEEVAQAIEDGMLLTDFDGEGVWIGDLMRWRTIRAALASRSSDAEREELKTLLRERMAVEV